MVVNATDQGRSRRARLTPAMLVEVAEMFRVLGDPSRLEILQSLMSGPRCVSDVVGLTGKGQANVSKHLAVLAAAGVVARSRHGTQVIYEVVNPLVFDLCGRVCGAVRGRLTREVRARQRALRGA